MFIPLSLLTMLSLPSSPLLHYLSFFFFFSLPPSYLTYAPMYTQNPNIPISFHDTSSTPSSPLITVSAQLPLCNIFYSNEQNKFIRYHFWNITREVRLTNLSCTHKLYPLDPPSPFIYWANSKYLCHHVTGNLLGSWDTSVNNINKKISVFTEFTF